MGEIAIWATLEVLPGQQAAAEEFFAHSREVMEGSPEATSFFVVRLDETTYGFFETFADQAALARHAATVGEATVEAKIGTIFAGPPAHRAGELLQRT